MFTLRWINFTSDKIYCKAVACWDTPTMLFMFALRWINFTSDKICCKAVAC